MYPKFNLRTHHNIQLLGNLTKFEKNWDKRSLSLVNTVFQRQPSSVKRVPSLGWDGGRVIGSSVIGTVELTSEVSSSFVKLVELVSAVLCTSTILLPLQPLDLAPRTLNLQTNDIQLFDN